MTFNVGDSCFDIAHHVTTNTTNIITKKASNAKDIVGILEKDQPVKVKDLKQPIAKGKVPNFDKLLAIELIDVAQQNCQLATGVAFYQNFTVCPIPLLDVTHGMDQEHLRFEKLILGL